MWGTEYTVSVMFSSSLKGSEHLSDLVESPVSAPDLKLGPDLELLLLLLKVHQVPLVLQPGLTPFPELQKQSYCRTDLKEENIVKSPFGNHLNRLCFTTRTLCRCVGVCLDGSFLNFITLGLFTERRRASVLGFKSLMCFSCAMTRTASRLTAVHGASF